MDTTDHDTARQQDTRRSNNQDEPWQPQQLAKNKWKATAKQPTQPARQSEGGTSPERISHSAPIDPNRIKIRQHNRFQPLQEERNHGSRDNDKVKEGSVLDANNSRGSRMRDPISLTPEIMAMLDGHEPDKTKNAKLFREHLSRQRVLPSTEEELQQHLERKAKREAERQLVVAEAEGHVMERAK